MTKEKTQVEKTLSKLSTAQKIALIVTSPFVLVILVFYWLYWTWKVVFTSVEVDYLKEGEKKE